MNKLAESLYRSAPSKSDIKEIKGFVYPSTLNTIKVVDDQSGGAYNYILQNSRGYNKGRVEYDDSTTKINFVKNEDGSIIPGVQEEQLLLILLDRTKKLNKTNPNKWNDLKIQAFNVALDACKGFMKSKIADEALSDLIK